MEHLCLIDNKKFKSLEWLVRYLKKQYDMTIYEYFDKYFKIKNLEVCPFCNMRYAQPHKYKISYDDLTVTYLYKYGYMCNDINCKNDISLKFLNKPYDVDSFQRIGSKAEYLAVKNKITIEESKKMKYNPNANHFHSSLDGFIKLYGNDIGTQKYNDRCEKISKANSLDFFIDRYGEEIGNIKWNSYLSKISCGLDGYILRYGEEVGLKKYKERCEKISYSNTLDFYINKFGEIEGTKKYNNSIIKFLTYKPVSKASNKINDILNNLNIEYEVEYKIINKKQYYYIVDYFLPKYNICIEFYGDFWHCNPSIYESSYYHPYKKMSAKEIWDYDYNRCKYIIDKLDCSIILIWESKKITPELLEYEIINIKNNKTIITI